MKQRTQTPRTAALQALIQMNQNTGYSNIVLDHVLTCSELNEQDKALASVIFYGVLERRLTLDYFLQQCLADPKKRLDITVQEALRCGAYQIIYLNRVPDSAAVNETVTALKLIGKPQFSGLTNGVLRNLTRRKAELKLPEGEDLFAQSVQYSVPVDLIRLWRNSYGRAVTKALLDSLSTKSKIFIRVNEMRCTAELLRSELQEGGVEFNDLPELPGAGILSRCGAPDELKAFQDGLFHVQDLSAQWICKILDPQPGETVCDCCAAPGGKSFTIAQMVGGGGTVYAFDLYENRVWLIRQGAERLGLHNIKALINDSAKGFDHNMPQVDKMLCDVPCSGFGVIRRKPEIRYKKLDSLKELPRLQYKILSQAAQMVRPGGRLLYSTCTLNPAENQDIAEKFLQENNGFEPLTIDIGLPHVIDEPAYMLTMTPFSGASDGFFTAAFQKKQNGSR